MNFPVSEQDHRDHPGIKFWLQELRYDPQQLPAYVGSYYNWKRYRSKLLELFRATIHCSRSGGPADASPDYLKWELSPPVF